MDVIINHVTSHGQLKKCGPFSMYRLRSTHHIEFRNYADPLREAAKKIDLGTSGGIFFLAPLTSLELFDLHKHLLPPDQNSNTLFSTICPGSSYPFYIGTYYRKGVTTSWTYCTWDKSV